LIDADLEDDALQTGSFALKQALQQLFLLSSLSHPRPPSTESKPNEMIC
jgi:hypothetical protein